MAHAMSLLLDKKSLLSQTVEQVLSKRQNTEWRTLLRGLSRKHRLQLIIALVSMITTATGLSVYKLWTLYKDSKESRALSGQLHRTSSSMVLSDGWSRELFVDINGKKRRVVIHPTKQMVFEAHKRLFLGGYKDSSGRKKGRNSTFFIQLQALWSIMVPRLRSRTTGLLLIHAMFLGLRTWISLLVASLDGRLVRDLVAGNGKKFSQGLLLWFLIAIPASYTNSMIKYIQVRISIAFRTKLVRYIHDIYLDSQLGYYKVTNIDGTIEGADQYITADLTRFCDAVASLYSSIGKPTVDLIVFSLQLRKNLGPLALMGIFSNYALTAWVLRRVAPAFGKLAATEAQLEGEYRNSHTRLIMNAEEIAFYEGSALERTLLTATFDKLLSHTSQMLKIKVSYSMFEDFLLKYSWSAWGYLFASIPVFLPTWSSRSIKNSSEDEDAQGATQKDLEERGRMRDFITNKRLMLSLADAGGRMMYSIKDLAELAGYTTRVFQLLATLHRVHANAYGQELLSEDDVEQYSLADIHGTTQKGFSGVRFENTPIAVPGFGRDLSGGELLIKDLNIIIEPGQHLLITGSNGVGKTSIARVLAGLWPVFRGLVSKPLDKDISFLPQRPYLSHGTLREQFIYPYTHAQMLDMGKTDDDLMEILKLVKLDYIPPREGGWETKKQWKDVLSGGEKQRAMFARILFKQPKFAIIDEGTSAVSADVEGLLYETCKLHDITIITISHRIQLLKYHTAVLTLGLGDDGSEWSFEKTDSKEAKMSVGKEIEELQKELAQVEQWKARRKEISKALGI